MIMSSNSFVSSPRKLSSHNGHVKRFNWFIYLIRLDMRRHIFIISWHDHFVWGWTQGALSLVVEGPNTSPLLWLGRLGTYYNM